MNSYMVQRVNEFAPSVMVIARNFANAEVIYQSHNPNMAIQKIELVKNNVLFDIKLEDTNE